MSRSSSVRAAHAVVGAASAVVLAATTLVAQPSRTRQVESVLTSAGPISVQEVTRGLEWPWGMAALPDGRFLVTEREGRLRLIGTDGQIAGTVSGTPNVFSEGQGGLQDVALDPDFATNGYVYLSYAAHGPEGSAATALGRGVFRNDSLHDFTTLFRQEPWITGPNHFGSRIAFGPQGHLFLAMGERFQFQPAQDLSNHLGTIVRLNRDGTVPRDNPFVGRANAQDAIWSYGHRNIESAAVHPTTGDLWVVEMGPLGGDELNLVEKGRNYGWPVVSWGMNYDGTDIPDPPTRPEFADAAKVWTPVISPSGMIFYTGDLFPAWRGHAFVGSLSGQALVRVAIDGRTVTGEEQIPLPKRIRAVEQGRDGAIYLLTDEMDGSLWKVIPLPVRPR